MQVYLQGFTALRNKEPELRILDQTELAKLSAAVLLAPDLTKACIFLCMNTGIRLGELCVLKREDIDFEKKTLSVTEAMQRVQKKDGTHLRPVARRLAWILTRSALSFACRM